jgi:hypothetical protein
MGSIPVDFMAIPANIYLKSAFSDTFRYSQAVIWRFDRIKLAVADSASCKKF